MGEQVAAGFKFHLKDDKKESESLIELAIKTIYGLIAQLVRAHA